MCNRRPLSRCGPLALWVAGAVVFLLQRVTWAGFVIEQQQVWLDPARRLAHFQLDFSRPPDFAHTDAVGRQADSFQFYVNPAWSGDRRDLQLELGQIRDVIRGEEIHLAGTLPVRDATPSDTTGPEAGGWGRVKGVVPFKLRGRELEFQVPWSMLGSDDGVFSYEVIALNYGSETSDAVGTSTGPAVPLPAAAWPGAAMLTLVGIGIPVLSRRKPRGHCLTTSQAPRGAYVTARERQGAGRCYVR